MKYSKIVLTSILSLMSFSMASNVSANDESDKRADYVTNTKSDYGWYSSSGTDELKKVLELKFDEVDSANKFLNTNKTFIAANVSNKKISFFWNAPNISSSVLNEVTSQIQQSGYGTGSGIDITKQNNFIDLPDNEHAKTAMEKYGFNIPSPTYMGESPKVTIDVNGVVIPQKPTGFVSKIVSIFQGKVNSISDYKDQLKTLTYQSPSDYDPSKDEFPYWIKKHWSQITNPQNKHYIKPEQVVNTNATHKNDSGQDDGTIDGKGEVWVMDNVVYGNPEIMRLNPDTDYQQIYNILKETSGDEFPNVVKGIVLTSGITNNTSISRLMPYDLSNMTTEDKNMFNGVADPRTTASKGVLDFTSFTQNMLLSNTILKLSGFLAELTVAFNRIGSFAFFEGLGLKPTMFWDNVLIRSLMILIEGAFIIKIVSTGFKIMMSSYGSGYKIFRLMAQFFAIVAISTFAYNPSWTYDKVKEISSTVLSISNQTLYHDKDYKDLYGTGNDSQKADTTLWLPYFNMWTKYQTGHSLNDQESDINFGYKMPETNGMNRVNIDGVYQNKWSTMLADPLTNPGQAWGGNIYRMVDHFLQPRMDVTLDSTKGDGSELNRGKITVSNVHQNSNYNGPLQSKLDLSVLATQILLLSVNFIKAVLFIEFFVNISLIFFRLLVYVNDGRKMKREVQMTFAVLFDIIVVGTISTVIVQLSMMTNGIAQFVVTIGLTMLLIKALKYLVNSNTVFKPRILSWFSQKTGHLKTSLNNQSTKNKTLEIQQSYISKKK